MHKRITVKLFAWLGRFLPPGNLDHAAVIEVGQDATPEQVLTKLGVPIPQCHLVLINGLYVKPDDRNRRILAQGDTLAVWPPIAGG